MDTDILKHIGEMSTLSQVINALSAQGYIIDFNLHGDQTDPGKNSLQDFPDEYLIDNHFRFEGESDPDDEAIVYAISSIDRKTKGLLVDGYGTTSQSTLAEVISKLKFRKD